jgi:hypothetical protein
MPLFRMELDFEAVAVSADTIESRLDFKAAIALATALDTEAALALESEAATVASGVKL